MEIPATPEQTTIRLVDGWRMQCKDIPDSVFLDAVRRTPGNPSVNWRTRWDVQVALETAIGNVPENLFLAKVRRLITKGVMGGCDCGCRGDYHLPEECVDPDRCCPEWRP